MRTRPAGPFLGPVSAARSGPGLRRVSPSSEDQGYSGGPKSQRTWCLSLLGAPGVGDLSEGSFCLLVGEILPFLTAGAEDKAQARGYQRLAG